jgi:hypothetical protein
MISGIYGHNGIVITGGGQNPPNYVNNDINSAGPGIPGELRVIGNTIHMWNSGFWTPLHNSMATVELTPEIQSVLSWARIAMKREEELAKLVQEYPAVKSAKENLDIVVALTKDYSKD